MHNQPTNPSVEPMLANQLATLLASIHLALAKAKNEHDSLAAVMPYLERSQPHAVQLYSLHMDSQGAPVTVETVSIWEKGQLQPGHPSLRQQYELAQFPLSALFLSNAHEVLFFEDLANDPRCDEQTRQASLKAGHHAMAILPLYSLTHNAWQGLIVILWADIHVATDTERSVYALLMATLASFLANRRAERALRAALKEKQQQSSVFRETFEHMPVGIFMVEAGSGKPQLANRMAIELLGRAIDPNSGKDAYSEVYQCMRPGTDDLFPSEELPLARALATGEVHSGEIDIVGGDSQRRLVHATAVPIRDESGQIRNVVAAFFDISQRKRAELERQRMQEELIAMQAAALAERSTPLIPITDEIVVVPLIGTVDAERGNQLMDTLLHGVTQSRARVAIIDITGIRTLDTQAASLLTGAAQALRLLGVEPVLTGIRAEVAQTLVSLGVRLDGIATRNNLQSGITLALKYSGRSTLK